MDKEDIFHKAVMKWGPEAQIDQLTEECAELIQALNKWKHRGKDIWLSGVIEEMADVEVMIEQVEHIFQRVHELNTAGAASPVPVGKGKHGTQIRDAINKWKELKLKRIAEKLES